MARLAEAALARGGGDPAWEAAILDGEATIFKMESKYPEALRGFGRSLAISEKHHLKNLYVTYNNLGGTYKDLGEYERALASYRRALSEVESLKGDFHPETASLEFNLGNTLTSLRRYREAEAYLQRSLAKREKILGPDHLDTAESLIGLGVLWESQGHPERSLPYQERALVIYARQTPGSLQWLSAVNNVGDALRQLGRYEEAARRLREGLAVSEGRLGRDNYYLSYLLDTLGNVYLEWGKPSEAISFLGRAEAILERQGPPEELANTQFSLARALWSAGTHGRARAFGTKARDSYGRAGDLYREDARQVERWLARHGAGGKSVA